MKLMTQREKNVMAFIGIVKSTMDWHVPIESVKIADMKKFKGLCVSNGKTIKIIISDLHYSSERDFWHTVLHELIHAELFYESYPIRIAAGHGKVFKKYAKRLAKESKGLFNAKRIIHSLD